MLDHVLFFGPPGLGKTTLAQIVAREMGVGFRGTSGPVIARAGGDFVTVERDQVHFLDVSPKQLVSVAEEVGHQVVAGDGDLDLRGRHEVNRLVPCRRNPGEHSDAGPNPGVRAATP